MAKTTVNAIRLKIIVVNFIPQGVKFNIKPTIGTSARLIPKLSATRSIISVLSKEVFSGILAGKRTFTSVKPGKNRTKMMPSEYRKKTSGTLSPVMVNTAIVITVASNIVVQYHVACFEKIYSLADEGLDSSCLVKRRRFSFSSSMSRLLVSSGVMA